jgi:hypothetical protein
VLGAAGDRVVKIDFIIRRLWRDAGGHEIDLLLDLGDRLLPIEVKSGMTVSPDMVDGLRWWTALPGNSNRGGALAHGGDQCYRLHGFPVRPWFVG